MSQCLLCNKKAIYGNKRFRPILCKDHKLKNMVINSKYYCKHNYRKKNCLICKAYKNKCIIIPNKEGKYGYKCYMICSKGHYVNYNELCTVCVFKKYKLSYSS